MLRAKKQIRKLEKQFVSRSANAFAAAFKKARATGHATVIAEKGIIYQVAPDGRRMVLKQVAPPTQVKQGLKVHIRK